MNNRESNIQLSPMKLVNYANVVGPEFRGGSCTSAGFKLVSQALQKSAVYTYSGGALISCGLVRWYSVSCSSTWIQLESAVDVRCKACLCVADGNRHKLGIGSRGIMAVASCKAWPLLGTRLSNVVACRGMAVDIGGMRKPYGSKEDIFDFKHLVAREPFAQFKAWFDEATKHEKVTTEEIEDELLLIF